MPGALRACVEEAGGRLAEVAEQFRDASAWARGLAASPAARSLHEMERLYGKDLDARSHGESFLKLFEARLVPGGLYLLDEPEAPLSPQNQLALIAAREVDAGVPQRAGAVPEAAVGECAGRRSRAHDSRRARQAHAAGPHHPVDDAAPATPSSPA